MSQTCFSKWRFQEKHKRSSNNKKKTRSNNNISFSCCTLTLKCSNTTQRRTQNTDGWQSDVAEVAEMFLVFTADTVYLAQCLQVTSNTRDIYFCLLHSDDVYDSQGFSFHDHKDGRHTNVTG